MNNWIVGTTTTTTTTLTTTTTSPTTSQTTTSTEDVLVQRISELEAEMAQLRSTVNTLIIGMQPPSTEPTVSNTGGYIAPSRALDDNQLSYGFGGCGGHLSVHLPSDKGVNVGPDFFIDADGNIHSPQIEQLQRQALRCETMMNATANIPRV